MQQKRYRVDMDSISKGWCFEKKREEWCKYEHTKKKGQKITFLSLWITIGFPNLLLSPKTQSLK